MLGGAQEQTISLHSPHFYSVSQSITGLNTQRLRTKPRKSRLSKINFQADELRKEISSVSPTSLFLTLFFPNTVKEKALLQNEINPTVRKKNCSKAEKHEFE